jgi:hypothetical protein
MSEKQKTKVIEWTDQDGPHKVIVPEDCNDRSLGVAVGFPFELVLFQEITRARVARKLRECGIWTRTDLIKNVRQARAALISLTGDILAALLEAAREV